MNDGTFSTKSQSPFGYCVSVPKLEQTYNKDEFKQSDVDAFVEKHKNLLEKQDYFYGIWTHLGKVYLDVTKCYSDKMKACYHGILAHQKAIYDLSKGESIFLPEPQTSGTLAQQSSFAWMEAEKLCKQ